MSAWDKLHGYFAGMLNAWAADRRPDSAQRILTEVEINELLMLLLHMKACIPAAGIPRCSVCLDTGSAQAGPGAFGRCPERCWEREPLEFESPKALERVGAPVPSPEATLQPGQSFKLVPLEIKVRKR